MSTAEPKSKKPSNSAFKQQRLKAWQPILTPKSVLPTFFVIGLIFVPLGVGLYVTSQNVKELVIDYTACEDAHSGEVTVGNGVKWQYTNATKNCRITFSTSEVFTGPVFLYYRLTNFYQNHRRYVKSFSSKQLLGGAETSLDDCDPIIRGMNAQNTTLLPVYPCGLIANSLFNDSYSALLDGTNNYTWSEKGIAWPSDRNKYGPTTYAYDAIVPPPNWSKYNNVYNSTQPPPNLQEDEHFQVWMRTAGLPNFRKLWGRSDTSLPAGTWTINVLSQYPVRSFGGTKAIVISTTSWIGGKNPFLGIAYMTVGSICIFLGIVFLIRHIVKPRKLGDTKYLSWNKTQ